MQSKRKTLKTHFIERYSASLLIGKRVLQEQTSFKRKTNINEQEQIKEFYAHLKPSGTFFPQALRSKLTATGTLSLTTPKTLALIAVHKHNAASRSARPLIRVQHSSLGGVPRAS
jgi:hypothetical protein